MALTRHGPKRVKVLDPNNMVTLAARVPASLLLRLDEEAARISRATGMVTVNRSDLVRMLLERALQREIRK
jgi:hypothetical protein